jgi:hypothetical protein
MEAVRAANVLNGTDPETADPDHDPLLATTSRQLAAEAIKALLPAPAKVQRGGIRRACGGGRLKVTPAEREDPGGLPIPALAMTAQITGKTEPDRT